MMLLNLKSPKVPPMKLLKSLKILRKILIQLLASYLTSVMTIQNHQRVMMKIGPMKTERN